MTVPATGIGGGIERERMPRPRPTDAPVRTDHPRAVAPDDAELEQISAPGLPSCGSHAAPMRAANPLDPADLGGRRSTIKDARSPVSVCPDFPSVMGWLFWAYPTKHATQPRKDMFAPQDDIASLRETLALATGQNGAYLNVPDRLRKLTTLNFDVLAFCPWSLHNSGRRRRSPILLRAVPRTSEFPT